MTANKNKIIIAPKYITKKSSAKNSHSNKNSKHDATIKLAAKNKIENTGCLLMTTIEVLITRHIEKK